MWAVKRKNEAKSVKRNSQFANYIKSEVSNQMYETNTKRWEEIS